MSHPGQPQAPAVIIKKLEITADNNKNSFAKSTIKRANPIPSRQLNKLFFGIFIFM